MTTNPSTGDDAPVAHRDLKPVSSGLTPTGMGDAVQSLIYRERLHHLIFELMPGSVLLMNAQGIVLDVNPAFCRQIGFTREELVGGHVSRFSQEPIEAIEEDIARVLAGEVLEHEVTNVQKDGSPRRYELRETAIDLPDGTRGILALSNDITDRVRAELEKFDMERQLLYADKLKSLGLMAGGIAHDFNNLLAAIIGNIELAVMDLDSSSPVQKDLRGALTAARRAADLTRQMLAYSGSGRFVVHRVDLGELVRSTAELLNASISKKASLEFCLGSDLPFIEGDAVQIQQILANLVTNASDALGDEPGLITITTAVHESDTDSPEEDRAGNPLPPGRHVMLEVRDTGCGMDESVQARLFDPFFTTKFTGRGLGMSAVLGIVRGHNATIKVSSRVGAGTVIRILFPALSAKPPPKEHSKGDTETLKLPGRIQLHGTVLVAEDETPVRLVVERIFQQTGLRVLAAMDGEQALALYQQHADEIIFVLLDISMPKMDGFETMAQLRLLRPQVKVVLTSGSGDENILRRCSEEAATAFIRKPYGVETLISLAQKMCAHGP